jgi:hypothetical protein
MVLIVICLLHEEERYRSSINSCSTIRKHESQ